MKSKLFSVVMSVSALILLSGCANYRANSLNTLYSESLMQESHSKTEGDITILAKAFDTMDCKRYLDRDVIRRGYQPVQLYIQNNSDKFYFFALNRLSLPYVQPEEVAKTVHTSTIGRVLGYGIPGIVIAWPLIIPAVVDGIKSSEANDLLDKDFYSKSVKEEQIVPPHSCLNKIIFFDVNDYQSNFTLRLIETESKKEELFNLSAS